MSAWPSTTAATLLAACASIPGAVAEPASAGRSDPGYGALDFRLRDRRVYSGDRLDGTNHIGRVLGGGAVVENGEDADGSRGRSLFFNNPHPRVWKQVWIREDGHLKEKTRVADPTPGAVRFPGIVAGGGGGQTLPDRTRLSALGDGRVRQVIEISPDDGKTWPAVFDAAYVPSGEPEGGPGPAKPAHDRSFWRGIAHNGFAVPAGESADALVQELSDYLGSPDPELRDDFAYSIAAAWIYRDRRVSERTEHDLLRAWSANLQVGLGGMGSDALFLRAFSALDLSLLAALDNQHPFLGDAEFADLLSSALAYLAGEKDMRAFDPRHGWMHATAHTADLLKFLGRNARLRPSDQGRILDGIAAKLRTAGETFTHGENERLAAAVQSLVLRTDVDASALTRFLASVAEPGEHLWDKGTLVDPMRFAATQNAKDLLRSLYVALVSSKTAPEPVRAEILKTLEKLRG